MSEDSKSTDTGRKSRFFGWGLAVVVFALMVAGVTKKATTDDLTTYWTAQYNSARTQSFVFGFRSGWCRAQGTHCKVKEDFCVCGGQATVIPGPTAE